MVWAAKRAYERSKVINGREWRDSSKSSYQMWYGMRKDHMKDPRLLMEESGEILLSHPIRCKDRGFDNPC